MCSQTKTTSKEKMVYYYRRLDRPRDRIEQSICLAVAFVQYQQQQLASQCVPTLHFTSVHLSECEQLKRCQIPLASNFFFLLKQILPLTSNRQFRFKDQIKHKVKSYTTLWGWNNHKNGPAVSEPGRQRQVEKYLQSHSPWLHQSICFRDFNAQLGTSTIQSMHAWGNQLEHILILTISLIDAVVILCSIVSLPIQ